MIRDNIQRVDVWARRDGDRFHLDHGHVTLRTPENLSTKPELGNDNGRVGNRDTHCRCWTGARLGPGANVLQRRPDQH
jgi:hypothetical protein